MSSPLPMKTIDIPRTSQYRKVMKPLLERKRRARINRSLDELKELLSEHLRETSGETLVKVEKADILEITVEHFYRLKAQRKQQQRLQQEQQKQHFRFGYIHAANEVSRCLASLPKVDVALGTNLMTHLGLQLNQLDGEQRQQQQQQTSEQVVNCGTRTSTPINVTTCSSPVSSGYLTDDVDRSSSPIRMHSIPPVSPSSISTSRSSSPCLVIDLKEEPKDAALWRPW